VDSFGVDPRRRALGDGQLRAPGPAARSHPGKRGPCSTLRSPPRRVAHACQTLDQLQSREGQRGAPIGLGLRRAIADLVVAELFEPLQGEGRARAVPSPSAPLPQSGEGSKCSSLSSPARSAPSMRTGYSLSSKPEGANRTSALSMNDGDCPAISLLSLRIIAALTTEPPR